MKKFCFDLDGTIFKGESLPYIAKNFGLWEEYKRAATSCEKDVYDNDELIGEEDGGTICRCPERDNNSEKLENDKPSKETTPQRERLRRYKHNLLKRIAVLEKVPVQKVVELLKEFEVNEDTVEFIKAHKNECAVVTSNLDCWVGEFLDLLGCEKHTSKASVEEGYIEAVESILDKRAVVKQYKAKGYEVIYIGDGLNDIDAMEVADGSIGFLASDNSWKGLKEVCDYCCYDQETVIGLLEDLSSESTE